MLNDTIRSTPILGQGKARKNELTVLKIKQTIKPNPSVWLDHALDNVLYKSE